ncbi:secretion protein HlyD [Candidatus Sumerlaeota bacterium]|nr:secretion protein HlyD [Candidatus Sumerlaeota bacterium]
MKKRIIVLLFIVGAFLAAAFPAWRQFQAMQAATQEDEPLIIAYGNIDVRQVNLAFRVEGRLQELVFEEGDAIKRGELVGTLDPVTFEAEVDLRKAELAAARAGLQRLEAGYRPQEIAIARAAVTEREATLATFQAEFERRQALVNDGAISKQSFDDIQARRDEAQARLQSAREELALRLEGYRQEDIAQAQAQMASREAQLTIARTRLEDTKLYAPTSGTVLTRVLEPGSIVRAGETVLTVSLADPVWARVYIPEQDLGRIHPGMKALIYTDSRPDHPYKGQVGFISPKAEFTPKNVETPELRTRLVYRLRVVVDNPDGGLRQGMPVTVKLNPNQDDSARRTTMHQED